MGFPFPGDGMGVVPDGAPPQPAAPSPGLGGRADYGAQQALASIFRAALVVA